MDKYNYNYEKTANYCYPKTDLLINKFDILDGDILFQFERKLVALRQAELNSNSVKGMLDFNHFRAIHKYLFQDIFWWAGEVRNCNIAKRDLFCLVEHIDSYATDIFERLHSDNFYIELSNDDTIKKIVTLFGDINALHPFREGNGRTQREFVSMLAKINGLEIDFQSISEEEMIEASYLINKGREDMMFNLFANNILMISKGEQLKYINAYINDSMVKSFLIERI